MPNLEDIDVVIDAMLEQVCRAHYGLAKEVVEAINTLQKRVISIDIPSGLFMDKPTEVAIHATETVTFQIPKCTLLPDNSQFVGRLFTVDIELDAKALDEAETNSYYLTKDDMAHLLKPLDKFTHKGCRACTHYWR